MLPTRSIPRYNTTEIRPFPLFKRSDCNSLKNKRLSSLSVPFPKSSIRNLQQIKHSPIHKKGSCSGSGFYVLSAKELVQNFFDRRMGLSSTTPNVLCYKQKHSFLSGDPDKNRNSFSKNNFSLQKDKNRKEHFPSKYKNNLDIKQESIDNLFGKMHPSPKQFSKQIGIKSNRLSATTGVFDGGAVSSIPKPDFGHIKTSEKLQSIRNSNYTPSLPYVSLNNQETNKCLDFLREESDLIRRKVSFDNYQTLYYKLESKDEKSILERVNTIAAFYTVNCLMKSVCKISADSCVENSEEHVSEENECEGENDFNSSCCSLPSRHCATLPMNANSSSEETRVFPALTVSHFPNVPPTINFVYRGYTVKRLPDYMSSLLCWRLSTVTPPVVKSALIRSRFRITKRNFNWIGCYGKHMKSEEFRSLKHFQKINHFPGSFQIGRKDFLWWNICRLQMRFGEVEYGFFPQTFILPTHLKLLKKYWKQGGYKEKWILKPPASARGKGIKVVQKWKHIPKRDPLIVQKYVSQPYLINGNKFDIRLYVLISSFDPLRIYMYGDGLVRFASHKYSTQAKSLNNCYVHLTNYSINKLNPCYESNTEKSKYEAHKWSLKDLWNYLKNEGVNVSIIKHSIKDIVIKTVISSESSIFSKIKENLKCSYSAYELYGFDILLDEKLKPWLLEVNISPSLHSDSKLDVIIKEPLVCDVLNIAGYHLPAKEDLASRVAKSYIGDGEYKPPNSYCLDKRLYSNILSPDEILKRNFYCQHHLDARYIQTITDILTSNDVRILLLTLDEESRSGGFERIFPSNTTVHYLQFFEQPRYSNLLLNQWLQRYPKTDPRSIALLKSYCEIGIHLESPYSNRRHQWSLPEQYSTDSISSKNHITQSSLVKAQQKWRF